MRYLLYMLLLVSAVSCGGGGGSPGSAVPSAAPPPVSGTPPEPTRAELQETSRLAAMATFGMNYQSIRSMAEAGSEQWLRRQFDLPPTLHLPIVDGLIERLQNGELPSVDNEVDWYIQFRRFAWWHAVMTADDQLRQRVAYALSQIMVVSDNVDTLLVYPAALSSYNDLLLQHAFGNFRDLLHDVALHPAMGLYLSHLNNRRADPVNNIFPDENFAREIMQLFSIGLYELNVDGTRRVDQNGAPIANYDNADIREYARVFTGLSWGGTDVEFGSDEPNFRVPMQMFEAFHEAGDKVLLGGELVPSGQSGMQDIEAAIDNLFNHPNVGPFISRQLIQRLVTSNPSPEYIERVARVFNGESSGQRGNLRDVIYAILTDPELESRQGESEFGQLREPVLRATSLYRQFNATSEDGFFANNGYVLQALTRQHPLSAPSVFNFYLPDHQPSGAISDAGLVAPEFQITTASTIVGMTNLVDFALSGFVMQSQPELAAVSLDLSEYVTLAEQGAEPLLDRLELISTYGTLSEDTRQAMLDVLADIGEPEFRAQMAIYMLYTSPDYAVHH